MRQKKSSRTDIYIWGLVLLAMIAWFNHEMIWKNQIPFFRDLGPYFYPLRFRLAESFHRGELLLWDRHEGMGYPLLADLQSGVFYLPHLLYFVVSFFAAVRILFVFHSLIAAFGAYGLCRSWGFPPYLAVIGGVLYALGGTMVSLTNLLNHYQAAVWLPWIVLFWERTLCSKSPKVFLCLVAFLLLQFLAGSPEFYAMTIGLLLLDAARVKKEHPTLSASRSLGLLMGANILVAAIGMAQLLPTLELFLESRGHQPMSYLGTAAWSLDPRSLLNLFFLDKEVDAEKFNGLHLFFVREIPFFISHYMGVICLFGITLWLFQSHWKEKTTVIALLTAVLVLSAGSYTPVHSLLYQYVPFFHFFRFPEKFFFLVHVILIYLTLRGLFGFLDESRPSSRRDLRILAAVGCVWLGLYIFCRIEPAEVIRFAAWMKQGAAAENLRTASGILFSVERQTILVCTTLGLFLLWRTGRVQTVISQVLLTAIVFFDLASAHMPYQYTADPDVMLRAEKIISAPDSEPNRLFYYPSRSALDPSSYFIFRTQEPSFNEFYALVFANLLPNTGIFHGFDYMQEIDALRRWPYLLFLNVANGLSPDGLYRLLARLNVRYVVSFEELRSDILTLVNRFPEYPSWLYRIDSGLPRTYVVSKALAENNPLKVIERLSSNEFDGTTEVILDKPLVIEPTEAFDAHASITDYGNLRVNIQASLNSPGVLVLADSFDPGWRAFVNGTEAEILRANLFFRAVLLKPGNHLVEFRYQPRSFSVGMTVSLATVAILIGAGAVTALRRRRQASHAGESVL
jgi:hypothetical protein